MPGNRRLLLFHAQEGVPDYLHGDGWDVIPVPVARPVFLPIDAALPAHDAVLLTSRAAAAWYVSRPHAAVAIAVSGEGTASVVEAAGLPCLRPVQRIGAEAALELLSARGDCREILHPRGEVTAGTAEIAAARLGLRIHPLTVYALSGEAPLPALGEVHAVGFGSGQVVTLAQAALPGGRWEAICQLPAVALGDTAKKALNGWRGEVRTPEKKADGTGRFCIPFSCKCVSLSVHDRPMRSGVDDAGAGNGREVADPVVGQAWIRWGR